MIGKVKAVSYDGKIEVLRDAYSSQLQEVLRVGDILSYKVETNFIRRLTIYKNDQYAGFFLEKYEGEWFEYCRSYQYNEELELYLAQRNIDYALDRNDKALFMQLVGGENK